MLFLLLSIVILYILFPNEIFLYSDTILGKIMAVIIVVYCTYTHVIYGLFACVFIIWFYQSDFLNTFKFRQYEFFTNLTPQIVYTTQTKKVEKDKDIQSIPALSKFDTLDKVYPTKLHPMKTEAEKLFRENHCSEDLELLYKNTKIIHKENVSAVFPEISFLDDIPCNPCDSICKFRVNKIDKETELLPKNARGNDTDIWEWATSWIISKNDPHTGVGSVVSYFS